MEKGYITEEQLNYLFRKWVEQLFQESLFDHPPLEKTKYEIDTSAYDNWIYNWPLFNPYILKEGTNAKII